MWLAPPAPTWVTTKIAAGRSPRKFGERARSTAPLPADPPMTTTSRLVMGSPGAKAPSASRRCNASHHAAFRKTAEHSASSEGSAPNIGLRQSREKRLIASSGRWVRVDGMARAKVSARAKTPPHKPPIVGIGASAGGVKALQTLFENLPAIGSAFVVILHLAPEARSELAAILAAPRDAGDAGRRHAMRSKPNHVYVIPPDRPLQITDNEIAAAAVRRAARPARADRPVLPLARRAAWRRLRRRS